MFKTIGMFVIRQGKWKLILTPGYGGKGTWGQVGMQFGVGVLLLVFVVFLLTEAAAIL